MNLPKSYAFKAIFTAEENGAYSVRFPNLDGCYTQGNSFDDARYMAQEAMSLHLYGMEQDGEPIPESDINSPCALLENEMLVPITVWMTPFRDAMENRAVKKTLTIPAWLNDAAESRGVNYSQILQAALKDYLGLYHA